MNNIRNLLNNNNNEEQDQNEESEEDEFDQLLFQDETYDSVEEELINALFEFTSEKELRRILKFEENESVSSGDEEEEESEREGEEEIVDRVIGEIEMQDIELNNENNDYSLNRSIARSILKSPSISDEIKQAPSRKGSNVSDTSKPTTSLRKSKSIPPPPPLLTETHFTGSLHKEVTKIKRYIPPKLLMEMDDVELVREDICAIDRLLAGYGRTGLSIVTISTGLYQKLGYSPRSLALALAFFIYGMVLVSIGVVRHHLIVKYIKKGYMKPSLFSIIFVQLISIVTIGISFYGITGS